jgi:hypothetical protein
MEEKKPKVNITMESDPNPDANRGDEEKFKMHRYMANKVKGFWKEVKKTFQI